jgi:hypothetical protein
VSAPAGERPWRLVKGGLVIDVRLTPRSSADRIDGIASGPEGPVLKARTRAVPDKGLANAAVERLIADWLGVPKRSVTLRSGGKSRLKSVTIEGDAEALLRRLASLLAALPTE